MSNNTNTNSNEISFGSFSSFATSVAVNLGHELGVVSNK
jgi:hypothetical protein